MKWSEYVEGSVQDTIFEGEDWVGFFANQGTPDMAASYFNAWFRRRWEMSASECCSVCELRPTTWGGAVCHGKAVWRVCPCEHQAVFG